MQEFFGSQFGQLLSAIIVGCAVAVLIRQAWARISNRHRRALDLSDEMLRLGFERIPRILKAYAVSDYAGALRETEELHKILLDPAKRNIEFATLFQRMLEHRLADANLRAATVKLFNDLTRSTTPPATPAVATAS